MKTAVLGATGYTGQILLRILAEHPDSSGFADQGGGAHADARASLNV